MKKLFKKLLVLFVLLIGNLTFAQTNLIENPSFEDGATPTVIGDFTVTDWDEGPYYRNCTYEFGTGKLLLFDSRSPSSAIDIPLNYFTTGLSEIFGGNRYVGIMGGGAVLWDGKKVISESPNDRIYSGSFTSTLKSTIEANCLYKVRFYASPIQADAFNDPNWKVNKLHNKIEVAFYNAGICVDQWIPFTSQLITTYGSWTLVEGFFIAPSDIGAKNLNKIHIRMKPRILKKGHTPSDAENYTGAFIDSLSLVNKGTITFNPTTNYSFTNNPSTTYNGTPASPWSGKNIYIENEFIVNSDLTINSSSKIKLATNAKITVKPGKKLIIDQTVLSGYCHMWEGITVETGGKIEITNTNLFDAKTGIKVTGSSSEFKIDHSYFDRNITHIELNDCKTQGTSNTINNNSLFHITPISDPSISYKGKGVFGIKIKNIASNNKIIIEGDNFFLGGQYGITIESSNADIKNNSFSQIQNCVTASGSFAITRIVNITDGNTFTASGNGITASGCYNLIVLGNSFDRLTDDAVKWIANNDREIVVGDGGSGHGNTFTECKPRAINLISNYSLKQKSKLDNLDRNTSIRIEGNSFSSNSYGTGINIQEMSRNTHPSYKKLHVSSNSFSNIAVGIRLLNITGKESGNANKYDKGLPPFYGNNYTDLIGERVNDNSFDFADNKNPEYLAVKVENSRGIQFKGNTSTHHNSQHWANKGIWLDNSSHSRVSYNTIKAGVGILAAGNMLQSNFLCNTFNENVSGFQLAYEYMRADRSNDPHGVQGELSRFNTHNNTVSWGQDIELYFSSINLNRWVYDNDSANDPEVIQRLFKDPKIAAPNVTSLLNKITVGGVTTTFKAPTDCSSTHSLTGSGNPYDDFPSSFTNTVMNWNYKYYAEKTFKEKDTLIASKDSSIAMIVEIEHNIDTGNIENALDLVSSFSPSNDIEENYAYLLNIWIEMLDSTFEHLDSTQFSNVNIIASRQTRLGGIPVYIARAILLKEGGMDYSSIDEYSIVTIKGKLYDSLFCIPDTLQGIGIAMVDESFNRISNVDIVYTNQNGEFSFDPYLFSSLDSGIVVGFVAWPSKDVSLLNPEFKPIEEWLDSININILSSGVYSHIKLEGVSVPEYNNDTVIVDPYANIYSVNNGDDNFVVSEVGSWSKVFNGHMNTYDKAIGIMKHNNGSLFIVTNINIDGLNGFEVWCMDSIGNLRWKKTMSDSIAEYVAFGFDTTMEGGVRVTATVNDGQGGGDVTQLIEINTCESFIAKYVSPLITPDQEEEGGDEPFASTPEINKSALFKVIPNPNNGSFSIFIGNSNDSSIFELYNLQGVKVYEKYLKQGINKIQLQPILDKGIYIGKLIDTKFKYQQIARIIVE